jgi:hypothetical protein
MSPLRMGSATVTVVTAAELADRAAALSQACTEGARELEPAQVDQAVNLVDKVRERTSIAGGHRGRPGGRDRKRQVVPVQRDRR